MAEWIVAIASWAIIGIGAVGFMALIFAIVVLSMVDFWSSRGDDDD